MSVPADKRRVRKWYAELAARIPEGSMPLEAVVTVKAIDESGALCLYVQKTDGLSAWEAYGMLSFALDDYAASRLSAATEDDE